jgi:hypothetical protein
MEVVMTWQRPDKVEVMKWDISRRMGNKNHALTVGIVRLKERGFAHEDLKLLATRCRTLCQHGEWES